MKTIGIIAELNPFHTGHEYLISKGKSITNADNAVIITSGNFVQRGMPAMFDKSTRAKAAIENGADVVFELPVVFSTASAEAFASSAVSFLDKLGCVDYLVFGCDIDNIKSLPIIANILVNEPQEYRTELNANLEKGLSFPAAREKALIKYCEDNDILHEIHINMALNMPNSILAIEYLKALKKLNSKIKAVAIKRVGADYNSSSIDESYASASAIREYFSTDEISEVKPFIPENIFEEFAVAKISEYNDYSTILGYKLINNNSFNQYLGISSDLSDRINNLKKNFTNITSFIKELQSKNYTYSGISRALIHIILEINNEDFEKFEKDNYFNFGRMLAFNPNSQILSLIKKNSSIPIVSKYSTFYSESKGLTRKILDINNKADMLYNMILSNKYDITLPSEFERQIIRKTI